jgi:hypothetical protein
MALAVLFAFMGTALGAVVSRANSAQIGSIFFLTVAASWAVLVPAKFWTERRGDPWARRVVLMVLGILIGLGALWLDGWSSGLEAPPELAPPDPATPANGLPQAACYLTYFALAFFALRWWRMADCRRPQRFSFAPILGAGFWGLMLLLLVLLAQAQDLWRGPLVLVLTSAIVQLVSPWEPPPPPAAKRMRLRYV